MTDALTFLHTAPAHVATFGALIAEMAPEIPVRHIVDESLLAEARAAGAVTPDLAARFASVLGDAGRAGARVIVCTCSTLGGCAGRVEAPPGSVVLRVDRPMAERAVALGARIVVAATLASTIGPTRELVEESARAMGKTVQVVDALCEGAWVKFERGDCEGYLRDIAARLGHVATQGDVIVLAQASMAEAAQLCPALPIPVLSSPRLGVEAAVAAYRAHG